MRSSGITRRCALLSIFTACVCGWLAPVAAAEFGPIQLVSKSSKEQAEFATEPALSLDGQFIAFVGELGGHRGILRKDLTTGTVTPVVEGRGEAQEVRGPSISADGRYVSFTTKQSLDAAADTEPETEDVYVADLATSPPTFELASSVEGHRMAGISNAAGRVAISADGSEVAFVNEGQVYVHRAGEEEPTLITVKRNGVVPEPVMGGGAYQAAGAALSADGNAVAWVGENLPEQVPVLPEEEKIIREVTYHEPLWRLVPTEGDKNPPTRRIVGGGDPSAPGCPAGGSPAEPDCQGPFPGLDEDHQLLTKYSEHPELGRGWGISLPVLSADGLTVATIGTPEEFEDLFVVDMSSGLTRVEAVRQLTKWINPNPATFSLQEVIGETPYTGDILECAISPDGERVAFTTQREHYAEGPTLATVPPSVPSSVPELYQVNLELETIERVTPGPGAGISLGGAGPFEGATAPSYSGDGRFLAFGDKAENLVAGDANGASDAFRVESTPPGPVEPSRISPPPSSLSVIPSWRLTAHAVSRPNGAVRVIATVPGAGTLRASAKSPLGPRLRSRVVSNAHRQSGSGGELRLELKLPRRLRDLAHHKGGLYTWLDLQFSGPGGTPLRQQFVARFRSHRPRAPKKAKGK